jgi:hypothetical protein
MCIAILNPTNKLSENSIYNSWQNNNQGAGLLWCIDGKLESYKSYKYKKFLNKYKELRNNPNVGSIVLHFRIATSGFDKYVNLHPFFVNENLGFVHNGIITGLGDNQFSDTYYFNEMLKSMPTDFLYNSSIVELISGYIGYSKLVFLDNFNNHTIINEKLGHWSGGNWFSNDSYKEELDFVYYGNEKKQKTSSFNYATSYATNWNTSSYDKSNLICDEELYPNDDIELISVQNRDYIDSFFKNTDDISLGKFLYAVDKKMSDFDLVDDIIELSDFYNTTDLKKITEHVTGEVYTKDNLF